MTPIKTIICAGTINAKRLSANRAQKQKFNLSDNFKHSSPTPYFLQTFQVFRTDFVLIKTQLNRHIILIMHLISILNGL
jgi:hypothetical protein